jgi:hypothetical protein
LHAARNLATDPLIAAGILVSFVIFFSSSCHDPSLYVWAHAVGASRSTCPAVLMSTRTDSKRGYKRGRGGASSAPMHDSLMLLASNASIQNCTFPQTGKAGRRSGGV